MSTQCSRMTGRQWLVRWITPTSDSSFTANGARVGCEDGVPRFADVRSPPGETGPAS